MGGAYVRKKIARQPKKPQDSEDFFRVGSILHTALRRGGATLNRVEPIACRSNWPHTTLYCILKCVHYMATHTYRGSRCWVCMHVLYVL